jgi:hypothetical protein
MAITGTPAGLLDEVADFLLSGPSTEELLNYRPSEQSQDRARELLEKQSEGRLSFDEQRELDQFELTERLMRLMKSKIHLRGTKRS